MNSKEYLKNYVIGVTGGIATGKTSVCQIIRELGYKVIDSDVLSRRVVEKDSEGLSQVVGVFGDHILNQDHTLNRNSLAKIIFSDDQKRKQLESILHPLIHNELLKEIAPLLQVPQLCFYEAALIIETEFYKNLKEIWLVHCPHEVQLSRLMKRNSCDENVANKIIFSQMPTLSKMLYAHHTINTDCAVATLKHCIAELLKNT